MTVLFVTVLSLLAGGWILVSVAGSGPVLAMHRVALSPVSENETTEFLSQVLSSGTIDAQWLSSMGFNPVGAYRVDQMPGVAGLVAWKKESERTYLCAYLLASGQVLVDIVTLFQTGMLTTGKSKDSQLLPYSPGNYMQSFTATTAVLYRRHQEGLQTLARSKKLAPLAIDGSFEADFAAVMSEQLEYIRSLALWPLRIPWWYFVRRSQRHDKTLAQLETGKRY